MQKSIEAWTQRYWDSVDVRSESECWEWRGPIRPDGYGSMWDTRLDRKNLAHRISVELSGRTIPDGMHTDHLCRNRRCVNPAHLEVVTHRENMRRGAAWPGVNARKTHCPAGHEYAGDNLRINSRGERICRACTAAINRRQYLKRAGG